MNSINELDLEKANYFQELVGLIANEILTYHNEIKKREELIGDLKF